jgi:hypothetical protein
MLAGWLLTPCRKFVVSQVGFPPLEQVSSGNSEARSPGSVDEAMVGDLVPRLCDNRCRIISLVNYED